VGDLLVGDGGIALVVIGLQPLGFDVSVVTEESSTRVAVSGIT
jgi:hypothetical protein